MTTAARAVLLDCEAALDDLRTGATGLLWRTRWVAAVALLRTVGHVLDKVDGERNPELRAAITSAYAELKQTRPEPKIFWEFIEEERNNVLKIYQFGVQQNVTVRPGAPWTNLGTGESGSIGGGPTTYEHLVRGGPFAGQDPRDVVGQAIEWWREYLDDIDRHAV
jgi:hypothetical protein